MREERLINKGWHYKPSFSLEDIDHFNQSEYQEVVLPHTNIELPFNGFNEMAYQFVSTYKYQLDGTKLDPKKNHYLDFEGVMLSCKVYLNNTFIGDHKGGYTAFSVLLNGPLNFDGDNIITVAVDSREKQNIPPVGKVVDYLLYGGIYREVTLRSVYPFHIQYAHIKCMDVLRESKSINLCLYMDNLLKSKHEIMVKVDILDNGETIKSAKEEFVILEDHETITMNIMGIRGIDLWDIHNPKLYHCRVEILQDNKVIDTVTERFGFRTVKMTKDGFYLNNVLIPLVGLNRHQSFPYVGYAMPKRAQEKDAEILKYQFGVNTVRCSHYPQSKHFLNRCDEIGLLVFEEIPGWQHIGNTQWKNNAIESVKQMILTDFNHPSIFIWGVRINESADDHEFYKQTNKVVKELDKSRPTGGVRYLDGSELLEDVYTFNDFNLDGKRAPLRNQKEVTKLKEKVPYLVTEYNGHMFPTKRFDNEERLVEHALRHAQVLDAMYGDKHNSGAIGWCMFDYNTHKDFGSGDKICYHGVSDMFRIPKYAANVYASQQDQFVVMDVASIMNIGEKQASKLYPVYVFTNCDYLELYKNSELIGKYYPDHNTFKHLIHPPIVITDPIGDRILNEGTFSKKDSKILKYLLIQAMHHGANLPFRDKLKMFRFLRRNKLTFSDAYDLFTKYVADWGSKGSVYEFVGYKDNVEVKRIKKGTASFKKLLIEVDSKELVLDDSWDTTRIVIKAVDDYNNVIPFYSDVCQIEVSKHLELIGPSLLPLNGGVTAFWVKTKDIKGKASIKVASNRTMVKTDITIK